MSKRWVQNTSVEAKLGLLGITSMYFLSAHKQYQKIYETKVPPRSEFCNAQKSAKSVKVPQAKKNRFVCEIFFPKQKIVSHFIGKKS